MALDKSCLMYLGNKKDCPVSQNGKTYRIINNSEHLVAVYEVDSWLIPDQNHQICDYLFLVEKAADKLAFFIGLKGRGIADAINQLLNSIDVLYSSVKDYNINARVVGKRVTPDIKSRRAKLDERLKQRGGNLKIVSGHELREAIVLGITHVSPIQLPHNPSYSFHQL